MNLYDITGIHYHDLPVDAIDINFASNEFRINVSIYDDNSEQYIAKEIIFSAVSNLALHGTWYMKNSRGLIDITDERLKNTEVGHHLEIIFNQGSGESTCKIALEFLNVTVKDATT